MRRMGRSSLRLRMSQGCVFMKCKCCAMVPQLKPTPYRGTHPFYISISLSPNPRPSSQSLPSSFLTIIRQNILMCSYRHVLGLRKVVSCLAWCDFSQRSIPPWRDPPCQLSTLGPGLEGPGDVGGQTAGDFELEGTIGDIWFGQACSPRIFDARGHQIVGSLRLGFADVGAARG